MLIDLVYLHKNSSEKYFVAYAPTAHYSFLIFPKVSRKIAALRINLTTEV